MSTPVWCQYYNDVWCEVDIQSGEPFSIPSTQGRKEGNVLFNDALNTFYLRLYGVRHMVKYHTYSERGNPPPPHGLPPHGLLFPINRQDCTYHSLCYTSRGTRNSSMGPPHEGSIRRPIAP